MTIASTVPVVFPPVSLVLPVLPMVVGEGEGDGLGDGEGEGDGEGDGEGLGEGEGERESGGVTVRTGEGLASGRRDLADACRLN